tara:strand:- start:2158 stop:2505 length:348 start_codon:yes stop_codon:yes gene_type:complete
MVGEKLMFKIFYIVFFISLFIFSSSKSEENIDQWEDSDKTYKDLLDEGYEVKGYDISTIQMESGITLMFFVTVLQKEKIVYECQEYQTLDDSMRTLDISFICRKITQPYKIGIGT